MPTTPYAKALVSKNSGSPGYGPLTAAPADVLTFSAESSVGVSDYLWEIYSYPSGFTVPSGWSTNPGSNAYYNRTASPSVTLPNSVYGKLLIRLTVNGGLDNGAYSSRLVDETMGISIPTSGGIKTVAPFETTQFNSTFGWAADLQSDMLLIAAQTGVGGISGGDLSGTYPNPTVAKIKGVSVTSTAPTQGQILYYNSPLSALVYSFVTDTNISDNTISGTKIADASLTSTKISGTLSPTKINLGSANSVLASNGTTNSWSNTPTVSTITTTTGTNTFGGSISVTSGSVNVALANGYLLNNASALTYTSTNLVVGSNGWSEVRLTAASTGIFRFKANATDVFVVDASTSATAITLHTSTSGQAVTIGMPSASGTSIIGSSLQISAQQATGTTTTGGQLKLYGGAGTSTDGGVVLAASSSATRGIRIDPNNTALNTVSAGSYGGGSGVTFISNATTVPTTNPTGGGILYCNGGALVYRGSSGTVTSLANA